MRAARRAQALAIHADGFAQLIDPHARGVDHQLGLNGHGAVGLEIAGDAAVDAPAGELYRLARGG